LKAFHLSAAAALFLFGCGKELGLPPKPPRIAFEHLRYDYGTVEQGQVVSHVFRFTNTGEADLVIERIRSGCRCSVRLHASSAIPSRSRGAIEVELDTSRSLGDQRGTVTVYTNDVEKPVTLLELVGHVQVDIVSDPPEVYVGRLRRGDRVMEAARIFTGANVTIASIDVVGSQLAVEAKDLPGGGRGKVIDIIAATAAPLGKVEGEIQVRSNSTRTPLLRIPVTGIVEDDAETDRQERSG
jgi:hypothetical protein